MNVAEIHENLKMEVLGAFEAELGDVFDPKLLAKYCSHQAVLESVLDVLADASFAETGIPDHLTRVLDIGMGLGSTVGVFAEHLLSGSIDLVSVEESPDPRLFVLVRDHMLDSLALAESDLSEGQEYDSLPGKFTPLHYPQSPRGSEEVKVIESLSPFDFVFNDTVKETKSDRTRRRSWNHFCFTSGTPVFAVHDSDRLHEYGYSGSPLGNDYHVVEFMHEETKTATALFWKHGCVYADGLAKLKSNPPEGHILNTASFWTSSKYGVG